MDGHGVGEGGTVEEVEFGGGVEWDGEFVG